MGMEGRREWQEERRCLWNGSKDQRVLLVFFITTLLISFAQRDTDLNHCDGDGETRVEIMAGGFEYMD